VDLLLCTASEQNEEKREKRKKERKTRRTFVERKKAAGCQTEEKKQLIGLSILLEARKKGGEKARHIVNFHHNIQLKNFYNVLR